MAEAIRPSRISAGVSVGTSWSMSAATAAALGAAEDVPKKLGKFCERLVEVEGWPGTNGGVCDVSMMAPGLKNDVFPPSGAVTAGFMERTGVDIGEPSGLRV